MRPPSLFAVDADRADLIMLARFRGLVERVPDQGFWAAYSFRSLVHGRRPGRPRRVFRLMVHLPGTEVLAKTLLFTGRSWAAWRGLALACQLHPELAQLWAGEELGA